MKMKRPLWFPGCVMVLAAAIMTSTMADAANCATPLPEPGLGEVVIGTSGGSVEILHASGFAHLELGVEMTPDNVFRIASLTKQFTAVAILALVEDGSASLDDPLAVYLSDAPHHWRGITLRQLLSHTSGLTADMTPVIRNMTEDMAPRDLIALFADEPLAAEPGTVWRYSNLNYWILGLIIESITNRPYADYIQNRVLGPAGVSRTRYGFHRDVIHGRVAGYEISQERCVHNARYFSSSIGYAAGGFVSTPTEMARWYDALGKGRIITPASVKLALTPVKTSDDVSTNYGLGWYVDEISGNRVAHHGGTSIGYSSYICWVPKMELFAAVFRNWSSDGGEPRQRTLEICASLMRMHGQPQDRN